MLKYIINKCRWIPAFLLVAIFCGCEEWGGKKKEREYDDVMLLYAAGYNSLSSFLKEDFNELKTGYVPDDHDGGDALLAYVHLKSSNSAPALMHIYKDKKGQVVTDTLVAYEQGTVSSSADQLGKVLDHVKENFPAKKYGLLFSSHSTGWLPAGYYTNSDKYERGELTAAGLFSASGSLRPVPYEAPEYDPSDPLTRSIGQDAVGSLSYEMELADFVGAIPMYMDYILFDTCLMGGIEVAYEFRDVCGKIGFSQTEVLAEGLDYKTLTRYLFLADEPMPEKVCEDYFAYYDKETGVMRSATISCVDCGELGPLAQVCERLFARYEDRINTLDPNKVQRYYRSKYHWFYDLKSILIEAGINEEELKELEDALDRCVIYKAATPSFMNSFTIDVFSGFSMFLPSDGGNRLKEFYKTLEWNLDTGLVK